MTSDPRARVVDEAMVRVDASSEALARGFLDHYLADCDPDDLAQRPTGDLCGAALAHFRLGRLRRSGEPAVSIRNPTIEADGWTSAHTVVMIVTDDMPFLVDSVRMVLARHELGIHLTIHPMLAARRSADGELTGFPRRGGSVEAWMLFEIDRCSAATAATLDTELRTALSRVRTAVDDGDAMRTRTAELAAAMRAADHGDAARFLTWIERRRFVFLGAARFIGTDGQPDASAALGLCRVGLSADPVPAQGAIALARTERVSPIHRPGRLTTVAVRRVVDGQPVEDRIVGLFSAAAYRETAEETPLLDVRVEELVKRGGFPPESHSGRALRAAVESLPRDLMFEMSPAVLEQAVTAIIGINERQMVRVVAIPEADPRFHSVLVYLPRNRFSGDTAEVVTEVVRSAYSADALEHDTLLGGSALARVHVVVRCPADAAIPDRGDLERRIDAATTRWVDRLAAVMTDRLGEERWHDLAAEWSAAVPVDYQAVTDVAAASDDLVALDALAVSGGFSSAIQRRVGDSDRDWRFKVYRTEPVTLSAVLPLLENLGLAVIDERPFEFGLPAGARRAWVYDIGVRLPDGVDPTPEQGAEAQAAFAELFAGSIENDGLNRLVLVAGMTGRQVAVLRGYVKYLRQTGLAFSQAAIEAMLAKHSGIARDMIALFDARFDPAVTDRDGAVAAIRLRLTSALDAVPSLDEDRIGRALLGVIEATLRTSAFRPHDASSLEWESGPYRGSIAFKLDPSRIPDLPLPRPMFEIWVYSPRVEGVHLRGGRVARGGLRWSDRREDFRTEVLGLMKAQMVKNAVIVPVGAKGGFVVKQPPTEADAMRAEVVACYRTFVSGLLDVTDNIVGDVVVPPPTTVRYDEDDPYLVVAADKGTATFSDTANELSARHNFWLGDAFASGGSKGYDHKAMAITARGAWESVRRHARALGKDADRDALTAVGIGDMSGDVFGNGMLLSKHLRLVAAFDHRHIFLDPDPDPAVAHRERARLFALARSSWADYSPTAISDGGGVFARTAKSIEVSARVRAVLGIEAATLTPTDLISAILRAPVDLLWNGGIGTYVKASTESHAEVGDRANDVLRIDGNQLRCKMIGEGGNLGFTQRGRVEYALAGGLVNTDAIDNSAGVDCSDHEVNIKILLNRMVAAGSLDLADRDALLVEMTDEVAEQVLDDNRAQTLALAIARVQAAAMVNVHSRYVHTLEAEGWMNRAIEFLPTDKQLADRQAGGGGLTTPEFAVLLAYTKNADIAELTRSAAGFADDPYFEPDLMRYFPAQIRSRFADEVLSHPLRAEITLTQLVNQMVNLSGISFDHRMTEETGAVTADVLRAWVVARDIFGLAALWDEIEALDVPLATQLALFMEARRMAERSVMWLLRHRRPPLAIAETVAALAPGVQQLLALMAPTLRGPLAAQTEALEAERIIGGVPASLAERAAVWPLMHTAFDMVELATRHGVTVTEAAGAYWHLFEVLDVTWLWNAIGALPRVDRWQTHARAAVRDDLLAAVADLTSDVLAHGGDAAAWAESQTRAIGRATAIFTEIRRVGTFDLTTLSVALRQLRNLVLSTSPS